jgi:hypothetical protein
MSDLTPAERIEAITKSLYRVHSLSRAIDFMVTGDDDGAGAGSGSTFRASIEEVNDCAYEAIIAALDHAEHLGHDLRAGGAA